MLSALPRDDLDPGDLGALTKIDHPCRSFDVVVIEHGTAVHADRDITIDSPRRLTTDPLTTNVSLVLSLVIDPRALLERHVLH